MQKTLRAYLMPYRDYLWFAVTLVVADRIWKWGISGEDSLTSSVMWLGMDVTAFFQVLMQDIAQQADMILHLFRTDITYDALYTLGLPNGRSLQIVWGCTPVKQWFIWLCLMLIALPRSWHKGWYIPLGGLLLYELNIVRIVFLVLVIIPHPDWFALWHGYILKYLFYGIMFLLWLLWVRLIGRYLQNRTSRISE